MITREEAVRIARAVRKLGGNGNRTLGNLIDLIEEAAKQRPWDLGMKEWQDSSRQVEPLFELLYECYGNMACHETREKLRAILKLEDE